MLEERNIACARQACVSADSILLFSFGFQIPRFGSTPNKGVLRQVTGNDSVSSLIILLNGFQIPTNCLVPFG